MPIGPRAGAPATRLAVIVTSITGPIVAPQERAPEMARLFESRARGSDIGALHTLTL